MKRPTSGSLKRVTAANLEAMGAERLAELLMAAAQTRPELKRRLRMELAANQGALPLGEEIDKRLGSLETSRGRIGWRSRSAFVQELDGLRQLIAERLAALDRSAAAECLWRLLGSATSVLHRLRDRDGATLQVFTRAAADLGRLITDDDAPLAAHRLVTALATGPRGAWSEWLSAVLEGAPPSLAKTALRLLQSQSEKRGASPQHVRALADAAGDVEAYAASFPREALITPSVAADIASRHLHQGRLDDAAALLRATAPQPARNGRLPAPDFTWETAWIEYLERSEDRASAQAVRWASFERTLSPERLRAFTSRLADFDDVEAEGKAFDYAARHADADAALRLLVEWPALTEAGALIIARADDIKAGPDDAELWAGKLRVRQPRAAQLLLRRAAATAFRRREFKTCDRLTAEADTIAVE